MRFWVYRESSGEVKHLIEITQRFTKGNANLDENTFVLYALGSSILLTAQGPVRL